MKKNIQNEINLENTWKLTRIAFAANVLAWIVLVYHILLFSVNLMFTWSSFPIQNSNANSGINESLFEWIAQNPLYWLNILFSLMRILLQGAIF